MSDHKAPNRGNAQGRDVQPSGSTVLAGGDGPEGRSLFPRPDGKGVQARAAERLHPTVKPLVYIAGPYTKPDPVLNTREACLVADQVAEMGAAVFVPHLSLFWHAISPAPIETWYQRDFDVLRHCNAVVQLPGESVGADAEIAEASRRNIPIFTWPVACKPLAAFIARWRP